MHRALAPIAAVSVLALTGCGGIEPDAHYDSAEGLRSALESEDYQCTEGATQPIPGGHGEEMTCQEGLSIVTWEEDLPDYVDDPAATFHLGGQLTGDHLLISDTWVLISENDEMIADIQETFGGEVVGPNEELMDIMEEHG